MRISDWSSDVCSSDLTFRSKGAYSSGAVPQEGPATAQASGPLMTLPQPRIGDIWLKKVGRLSVTRCVSPMGIVGSPPRSRWLVPESILVVVAREIGRASCRASVCQYG